MGNDNNACCSKNEEAPVAVFDLDTLIFKDVDFNKAETYKRLEKGTKEFLKKQNLTEQYVPLFSRIIANKQEHLIQAYKLLNTQKEKEKFLRSLESVDIQLVDSLFHNLINKIHRSSIQMVAKPCTFTEEALMSIKQKKGLFKKGLEMIQQRKVAIILLCGGSNTRFGGNIPKFLKQTNIPSKKCIMELLLIRLKKINYLANNNNDKDWSINIFIMCNQDNYQSIKQFLQKKKYCGIPQKYVHFFLQGSTPILNLKGQLCLNQQYKIIQSPNGSGQFLQTIVNFKMKNKIINQLGIQYLCISGLQNMLEIPCDPLLIGQMNQQNAQVIAKCTDIENQQQSFYRYVNINGKIKAVHPKRLEDFICYDIGKLQQSPIYMNSVIYDVMYLNKLLTSPQVRFQISRIFHSQKRLFTYIDVKDKKSSPISEKCYVFQKNLSDLFLASEKTILLKVNRQQQFAPVINAQDQYSIKESSKILVEFHANNKKNQVLEYTMFTNQQIEQA